MGADAAIMEKVKHYFSGVVMEARRYFVPFDQQREGDGDDGWGGSASDEPKPEDDE